MRWRSTVLAMCFLVPAGSALADVAQLAPVDRAFVERTASDGLCQVRLGQLAIRQGQSDAVRQLGQRMVDEHARANRRLKQIADREKIELPSLSPEQNRTIDRLATLTGEAFDRAYLDEMVRAHATEAGEFEREARLGHDAGLRSFARAVLPTLRREREEAVRDQKKM